MPLSPSAPHPRQPRQHSTTQFLQAGCPSCRPTNSVKALKARALKAKALKAHTHTQPFYGSMDFVWDNPGEPVPEETFTHSHLSWSSIVPNLLHPSNTIHGILPVQSTRLTILFHNLSPSLLWSTSWPGTLHFILFTQSLSSFCNTCPYDRSLFCRSTEIMSSNPSLSLSQPLTCNSIL